MARSQADLDRYLGLVAAGWTLVLSVPLAALPIAFLLLDRRPGHAWAMLGVVIAEVLLGFWLILGLTN